MSSRLSKPGSRAVFDVLLVDADRARADALADLLANDGLVLQIADSAEDAVAKSPTSKTLLVRRHIGSVDAFAFVRALKKKSETPPRVLILGQGPSADDALRAIDASALGIVFDPWTIQNLIARIRKAIDTDPADLLENPDAQVYRIRRGGVVFKMKSRPELLVDYLLQATESMAESQKVQAAAPPQAPVAAPVPLPPPPPIKKDPTLPPEHSTGAFMVVRKDGQVLFANPAARNLLTLPEDITPVRFDGPLDVERVVERRMKSGRRSIDVAVRTTPVEYDGQKALGVALRDVTELRNIESQLRLSNEILDRVPAIILVADPEGRVAYAGPGISTLLGYHASEAMGEGFWSLAWTQPEDAERMRAEFTKAARRDDNTVSPFEVTLLAKDGSSRILAFQFAKGPGGTLIAVGQDVTARKHAESESTKAREAAEAATAAKSDFLANMSHEIRTPMNAVIGMTSLLLDTELTAEQRDYSEIIQKSGETLISLISDILDFSKIEAGKFELDRHSCSAEGLVEQGLDLLAARASEKGLDLAGFVDATAALEFWGDGTRIRQILVNLLANAVKFTETGGVLVEVRLQHENKVRDGASTWAELMISVADTGIGIPADKVNRLFRAFSQIDASTTRRYGGTGLGLAISRQFAEMMGGRLEVESTPGKGSRFTLTIPVEVISKTKQTYLNPASSWLAGKRVLVCATGAMTTDVIARLISRWGGTSVRASVVDGSERLQRGETFDLAIVDHSRNLDARAASVSDAAIKTLKDRCIEKRIPIISLRPIASRNVAATQGISLATAMTPIKAAGLHQSVERALFGGPGRTALPSKRTSSDPVSRSMLSVLVAEDNLVNQKVARLTLQSFGFAKVDVVSNGKEVLSAMAVQKYDIVFLDLHMPEMDGLDTARAIRADPRSPRPWLVALTASAMTGDRERCLAAGMDDYLAKPLQRDALALVLDRAKSEMKAAEKPVAEKTGSMERRSTSTSRSGGQRRAKAGADPVSAATSAAIIDARAIERLRGLGLPTGSSGSDLVTELVDSFLRDVPDKLGRISKALAEDDFLKAHRFTHSLVSSAGNLGVVGVVKAARTLESVLRLKSRKESEHAFKVLQQEFDLSIVGLSDHRQK